MPMKSSSTFAQSYISTATCYLIDETDEEDRIAVHLPNGFFLVLSPVRVLSCCDVGVKDVSKILLFHTSALYCKYYLLVSTHSLIIVSHEKVLKVVKNIGNYCKYLIGDFTTTGYPALRVWTNDQVEPITIDIDQVHPVSSESPVTSALHSRLQLLKVHLENERKRLHSKQCLRKKTVEQLFYQTCNGENESNNSHQNILCLKAIWQKYHHNKWILGAVVKNTSDWSLTNIYLCAKNSSIRTKVLTKSSELPINLPNNKLNPGETAYIVGELNLPPFLGDSSCLDLNVAFVGQTDGKLETTLASAKWNLKASQVFDGSLTLLKDNLKDGAGADVAALCAISKVSVNLDIRCLGVLNEGASIHDLLKQTFLNLGFRGVPGADEVILVSLVAGLLIRLQPSSKRTLRDRCKILLQAVDSRESLVLIRALQDVFPDKVEVSIALPEGGDAAALSAALNAELLAIQLRKPRLDIAPLELETDLAMDRLIRA